MARGHRAQNPLAIDVLCGLEGAGRDVYVWKFIYQTQLDVPSYSSLWRGTAGSLESLISGAIIVYKVPNPKVPPLKEKAFTASLASTSRCARVIYGDRLLEFGRGAELQNEAEEARSAGGIRSFRWPREPQETQERRQTTRIGHDTEARCQGTSQPKQ